ncbi:MAG: YIP1 family protein [Pseudoruegeria sp.]
MPVSSDIVRSYVAPRKVLRRQFRAGVGEEQALAYVMIACFLFFIAQLPALSRAVYLMPDGPEFTTRAVGAFVGGVFFAPLFFYALAAISRLVSKLFGGRGTWLRARIALFWALLVVSPLVLLRGLVAGFIGAGQAESLVAALVGIMFLIVWILGLIEAEKGPMAPPLETPA